MPVEAKLRAPARYEGLVLRGQLIDRLVESRNVPVVLVIGPPGYGKTVLVTQWLQEDGRPFAWLSVDEADNSAAVFITYLMLALHRIADVDAGILATLTSDEPAVIRAVLPRLGQMLRRREPFVLVLDEINALTSEGALEVVGALEEHMPDGAQLTLIGRTAPPLDWHGMRARHGLVELGRDDLRLSHAEARALVQAAGLHLTEGQVEQLLQRTEGWPAGMYLATLSLSTTGERSPHVDTLGGSDSLIGGYLRDELLDRLTHDDQAFLTRVSILTTLSAPLCDAVLAQEGSGDTLRRLARSNVLLVQLDDEGRLFRLHQLFAEALRAELMRREPQIVKLLHSRATSWLEENGELEEAIAHATSAGEVERAARLIWSQVPACFASGRLSTLERWLDCFTPRQVAAHAKLALTAAACALQRGAPIDHWITSAEAGSYEASRPGESASVAGAAALLHAVLARNGVVQMGADARLAGNLLGPDDPWRCTAGLVAAVSTFLTGHITDARGGLEVVEQHGAASGVHQCRALALAELALIAINDEDWVRAGRLVEQAQDLVAAHRLDMLATLLPLHCVATLIAAHDGRTDEARALERRWLSKLALTVHAPAWLGAQCRYALARTELVLGDPAAARTLLSEAQTLLSQVGDATFLQEAVDQTWRQVEALPLDVGTGASTLTTAELRVLQFFPTHLSFEEIGRQLFVSRNTVKTQAVSAYRKLGVNSRSEAVERAYALGLILRDRD